MANGYLTFKGTASFTLKQYSVSSKTWDGTLEYSTDGSSWNVWNIGSTVISSSSTAPYVLYLRGTGNTKITGKSSDARFVFTTTGTIDCIGRIDTLLDYQTVLSGGTPTMANYCCFFMFYNCTSLTSAPALPATTLADFCYASMFYNCISLISAPALPATTLADDCYHEMFRGCTSLTSAPALPATSLATYCYFSMFYGCTSLTSVPTLPATTLKSNCYNNMFRGCTSIKLSTTQNGVYKSAIRIPSTGTGTNGTNSLTDMFTGTGGTFTGTPDINTTYYIAHTYVNNITLNAKWIENTSMTPEGLTAGKDSNGYVTESISRTLGNLVHCAKQTYAEMTTLSYMKYIMEGMMVARVVDFENLKESLLIGDFERLNCFKNRKRCTVAADGTINHWYGETGYAENGTDGDVMVYQPKFYYKVEPLKLEPISGSIGYHIRKAIYYISDAPIGGFKLHPAFINHNGNEVDGFFIGAYEGCVYDVSASAYILNDTGTVDFTSGTGDKFASITNAKPASGITNNLTADNILVLCKNKGTGWYSMGIKQYSMNQLMMLIEYGPNSQAGIASGVVGLTDDSSTNMSLLTGSTSSIGNGTGRAASSTNGTTTYTDADKTSVSYRGMENPYGNIWEFEQGASLYGNGSQRGGQPYIANDFNYVEGKYTDNYNPVGFTIASASNYVTAFGYGDEKYDWLMMASDTAVSTSSIVHDYQYIVSSLNGARGLGIGGRWDAGDRAGVFYWDAHSAGSKYRTSGGRLCKYNA